MKDNKDIFVLGINREKQTKICNAVETIVLFYDSE